MDLAQLENKSIIAWILNNDIKTERNQPLDFDKYSFMIDPYLDWSPLQGSRKASQCGWSIMNNLKLFYAGNYGIPGYGIEAANVIYTLPTDADVNAFVPSKTNLLIKHNPVIGEYLKDENQSRKADVDSIQRKKIGNSMVYFKGTKSKTAAIMLTSDLNIHDEADRSEKSVIDEYESRTTSSLYKGRWIFSNPSVPLMPADMMFLQSDQKHWFIKCERCGHWQYLDWKKLSEHEFVKSMHTFVDDEQGLYVCGSCATPISDANRRRGRWVKKYSNREISGYWVTHLMYSWVTAKSLLATESGKSKAYFMNFVLGLPYIGSDVKVDGQTIVNNIVLDERKWEPGKVAMGVDNGDVKHYVIGDAQGVFEIGKTKSWDDIEFLIKKYQPYTIIDLNPYPNKPRELSQSYRHVWCNFYKDNKDLTLAQWGQDDGKRHMVYIDRNKMFDKLIEDIVTGRYKFFNSKSYWEEFIAHWETMARVDVENNKGMVQGQWVSSTGMDHFCHAFLYYATALTRLMGGGGKVLRGSTPLANVKRELGGVPTVPNSGEAPHTMQMIKPIINLSVSAKPKKKNAATSGNA